jgi:hypothetical protein
MTTTTETFDRMLKLEDDVKNWRLTEAMGMYAWDRQRGHENRVRCQQELFSLFDGLSDVERVAFGEYRKQQQH